MPVEMFAKRSHNPGVDFFERFDLSGSIPFVGCFVARLDVNAHEVRIVEVIDRVLSLGGIVGVCV